MNYYVKQQILRMNTTAKFPKLIEIGYEDSSGTQETFRYCDAESNIVITENGVTKTFVPYDFTIKKGEKTDTSIGNGNFTISTVDQSWIGRVRNAKRNKKLSVRYLEAVCYRQNSTDYTDIVEETLYKLENVTWDDEKLTGTLTFDDRNDIIVPCDKGGSQITSGCV